jgi:hypothetical protein
MIGRHFGQGTKEEIKVSEKNKVLVKSINLLAYHNPSTLYPHPPRAASQKRVKQGLLRVDGSSVSTIVSQELPKCNNVVTMIHERNSVQYTLECIALPNVSQRLV